MAMDFSRVPPGFGSSAKRRDFERLKATLLERAESVCRHLYPAGRKEGDEWCVGSPFGEKGKSFKINLRKGVACDFNGGATIAGDMIAVWALATGVKQGDAYDEASKWVGDVPVPKQKTGLPWAAPKEKTYEHRIAVEKDDPDERWWRGREPTVIYEYVDADGVVWPPVDRWDDPVHGKHVQPRGKLPEGPRPLYNLPAILKASGPVVLVEGEKCANRLIALGYCATTAMLGAGGVAKADWSALKGRCVVLWPDNDQAGSKWLEDTTVMLRAAGASPVSHIPIPPNKPPKWDCADADDVEIEKLIKRSSAAPDAPKPVSRKDVDLPDFSSIQKRCFLYDTVYQRGFVSITAGEGGSGKSALHVIEALAICTGRDLHELGKPIERTRVWMIALEDDLDEMHRRIAGAMIHFGIDRSEIEGWLYLTTRKDAPDFLLATSGSDGVVVSEEGIAALKAEIVEVGVGVVMIDPYVYTHTINENDNMGQAAVMKALANVAGETNAAIAIVHHSKKPSANDRGGPSSSDMRGASSIVNASRHGRLVITMSAADAGKMGVDDDKRFFYFYTASVKASYTPPGRHTKWFKLHGITLPNGTADEDGDGVGVVTRWTPPDVFEVAGVTVDKLRALQFTLNQALRIEAPYLSYITGKPWVGEAVGIATGLDAANPSDKKTISSLLKTWLKSGALVEEEWVNQEGKPRRIVRGGTPA